MTDERNIKESSVKDFLNSIQPSIVVSIESLLYEKYKDIYDKKLEAALNVRIKECDEKDRTISKLRESASEKDALLVEFQSGNLLKKAREQRDKKIQDVIYSDTSPEEVIKAKAYIECIDSLFGNALK